MFEGYAGCHGGCPIYFRCAYDKFLNNLCEALVGYLVWNKYKILL